MKVGKYCVRFFFGCVCVSVMSFGGKPRGHRLAVFCENTTQKGLTNARHSAESDPLGSSRTK